MSALKQIPLALLVLLLFAGSASAADNQTYRNPARHQIELYVTSWCPYCKMAEAYLDKRGVEYRKYDVEKDAEAARRLSRLAGSSGIPFAVIDGVTINGWSEQAYAAALNRPQP
jgi:glutaredoxin